MSIVTMVQVFILPLRGTEARCLYSEAVSSNPELTFGQ